MTSFVVNNTRHILVESHALREEGQVAYVALCGASFHQRREQPHTTDAAFCGDCGFMSGLNLQKTAEPRPKNPHSDRIWTAIFVGIVLYVWFEAMAAWLGWKVTF